MKGQSTIKKFLLWEIALALLLAVVIGTVAGLRVISANEYLDQNLRNTALYSFQSTVNRVGINVLGIAAVVLVATLTCFLFRDRIRVASLFLSLAVCLYIGYRLGYELNRYDFKNHWLNTKNVLGIPVPNALLTLKVLAINGAILAAMLAAGWISYLVFRRLLGSLRNRITLPLRPGYLVLVLLLLITAGQAACMIHRAARRPGGPSVILISLDTLRGDNLGCYGYNRPVSPNIDRFCASAVLFENAVTQAGSTLPSHKSVLTSLYPPQLRNRGERRLDHRRITLPELLLNEGYHTAAFANGLGWVTPVYHFDQGFEKFDVPSLRLIPTRADAEEIAHQALSWLEKRKHDPFFLFLHFGDIHSDFNVLPYEVPEPYQSMFADPDHPPFDVSRAGAAGSQYLGAVNEGRYFPNEVEMAQLRSMYDGGIRYTDFYLGKLFDGMEELGLMDNTMIVIFSDHGEEFGEHGRVSHGWVYREVARVPLIVKFANGAFGGRRVKDLVQLLDIAPTILEHVQIPLLPEMLGRDLAEVIEKGGDISRAFTEGGEAYAMRTLDWMLRYEAADDYRELYDLAADPMEQNNLFGSRPDQEEELDGILSGWMNLVGAGNLDPKAGLDKIDRGTLERLKSLGYIND